MLPSVEQLCRIANVKCQWTQAETGESGWMQGETCFMGTARTGGVGQAPSPEAFET